MEKNDKRPQVSKIARKQRAGTRSAGRAKNSNQAAQLQRLAQAIEAAPAHLKRTRLSHAECEAALEFYADAEHRGERAQELYPEVAQHLQSCERCSLSYRLLTEALHDRIESSPSRHSPPASRRQLPFLMSSPAGARWIPNVSSRIGGAPLRFGFTLRAPVLPSQPDASAAPRVRRQGLPPASPFLLLSDWLTVGTRQVNVELQALPAEDPAQVRLQVTLAPSVPFHATIDRNAHLG